MVVIGILTPVIDMNNTGKIGMVDRYETEVRVGDTNPEVRDDWTKSTYEVKFFK